MKIPTLKHFIDNDLYRIKGFMHPVDAMAFSAILNYQAQINVSGPVAEIGVFHGRSFALMAASARPGERSLGLDLFDIDGQLDSVQNTLRRLHLSRSNVNLITCDSTEVTRAQLIAWTNGPVRFFSIDGGHEYATVLSDASLALTGIGDGGVIAFDDFFNPQYPDLTRAVLDFLHEHMDRLVPFAITRNKLYVCRPSHYERYVMCAKFSPLWASAERDTFSFLEAKVVSITQSLPNRAIYQTLAARGWGMLGDKLTRKPKHEFTRQ